MILIHVYNKPVPDTPPLVFSLTMPLISTVVFSLFLRLMIQQKSPPVYGSVPNSSTELPSSLTIFPSLTFCQLNASSVFTSPSDSPVSPFQQKTFKKKEKKKEKENFK
jgi:hypothetical protein